MKCLVAEANQWIRRLTLIPNRTQVILGLGAGTHALEFTKQIQGLVYVIEPRCSLVTEFFRLHESNPSSQPEFARIQVGNYEQILPQLRDRRIQVQQYRPCWRSHTEEFLNILDLLNLRDPTTASSKYLIEPTSPQDLVSLACLKSNKDEILLLQELIQ